MGGYSRHRPHSRLYVLELPWSVADCIGKRLEPVAASQQLDKMAIENELLHSGRMMMLGMVGHSDKKR